MSVCAFLALLSFWLVLLVSLYHLIFVGCVVHVLPINIGRMTEPLY